MGHLQKSGTQCLIVDDAHDLSLEHLMLIKEVTDQGQLQYGHPLGLCLVAAGRGATIPDARKRLICLIRAFLQFRRRLDKLDPLCRIAGHTSEEVREILAALETVFQQLFPQLNPAINGQARSTPGSRIRSSTRPTQAVSRWIT
jgi:hypothetical protein